MQQEMRNEIYRGQKRIINTGGGQQQREPHERGVYEMNRSPGQTQLLDVLKNERKRNFRERDLSPVALISRTARNENIFQSKEIEEK